MKLLYIVLDGVADVPIKALQNQTPLEAADKPYLDELSAKSQLGKMSVISKDIAPESDQATLALMGFNPITSYTGRGPLEAYGFGVKVKPGDIVLRCDFGLQERGKIIRAKLIPEKTELKRIAKDLAELNRIGDVKVKFIPTVDYRGVLILSGKNLSPHISNTHPGYQIISNYITNAIPKRDDVPVLQCKPLEKDAEKTAAIVNDWLLHAHLLMAHRKFSTNLITVRGAGNKLPKLSKRTGWAILADMLVEQAIGKLSGMKILNKPVDPQELSKVVKAAIKRYKAVYIQIKGTDNFSHDGDPIGKTRFIEELDSKFIRHIVHSLKDTVICVTADHTTSSITKTHTADAVPVLVYVPGEFGDYLRFNEKLAERGSLGQHLSGIKLFNILQKLLLFN
jgi:2,3-bisphosphoglycerate-independent phosphoglycerate mutase